VLGCLLVNTRLCFCMHDGYLCVCVVGDGVGLGLEEAWLAVAVVAVCPIFGRGGGGFLCEAGVWCWYCGGGEEFLVGGGRGRGGCLWSGYGRVFGCEALVGYDL